MGNDDYSAAVGGGLKLKGSKPTGVTKKKKRDKDKETSKDKAKEEFAAIALQRALADEERAAREDAEKNGGREAATEGGREQEGEEEDYDAGGSNKTEAERKWEEMRRKRLDERLRKEGVKTHKQRVEELNKYLSTLSEHHDMPRIGPG